MVYTGAGRGGRLVRKPRQNTRLRLVPAPTVRSSRGVSRRERKPDDRN